MRDDARRVFEEAQAVIAGAPLPLLARRGRRLRAADGRGDGTGPLACRGLVRGDLRHPSEFAQAPIEHIDGIPSQNEDTRGAPLVEELEQRMDEGAVVEHHPVGQAELAREAGDGGRAQSGEECASATGRTRIEQSRDRRLEPCEGVVECSRLLAGAVEADPASQLVEPVADIDAAIACAGSGVHVDREHTDRIGGSQEFKQTFAVEVCCG